MLNFYIEIPEGYKDSYIVISSEKEKDEEKKKGKNKDEQKQN